ncbi:VOC family protein [Streptomyces sp. NPDC059851]|uniref:VOC family protein n=1 Tax=Streptomyces sp. NPDC059851 TaxID=3346971 RepID=UPI00364D09E5
MGATVLHEEATMQCVLMIYHGTYPLPGSSEAEAVPEVERQAAYADHHALNTMENVTPGPPLGLPQDATTVRVENGSAVLSKGPYLDVKGAVDGFDPVEAEDLDAAVAIAARVPQARPGVRSRSGPARSRDTCSSFAAHSSDEGAMAIESVVLRQRVEDLDAAVTFYEKLTGSAASRFSSAGVDLAGIGPFLLFSGPDEAVQRVAGVAATLTVVDLDSVVEEAVAEGAEVVVPKSPTPHGHRVILRHPQGGVFEYVGA